MRTGKFIPVMLTPFLDNGAIDFPGLQRLTEYYIEHGAAGLFANCQSSEMFELTASERLEITRQVVTAANGKVPVISTGTFGGSISAQADFVKQMYDTGVEAVIAITSLLAAKNEPDELLKKRMFQLLEMTENIPFGFYECPEPYKRILPARLVGQFAATGRVIYYKDTSLSKESIKEKIEATKDCHFNLYDAYMVNAVSSLKAGCAGLSCIQGNYFADLVVWLCRNFDNASQVSHVQLVQDFFANNMSIMHDVYPVSSKYVLRQLGVAISMISRRDVGLLDQTKKENLDVLIEEYVQLKKIIGV